MAKKTIKSNIDVRPYMELAIKEMKKSKNEPRADGKVAPKVGAVVLFPNGDVMQAHRGELREGDHAEFCLIERKLIDKKLDDCILFTTLEPCVERNNPKIPCCRRTTNARIKKVYIGIVDPDPTVSTKGIKHLQGNRVEVRMFDRDLQKIIEEENKEFLEQALERKRKVESTELIDPIEEPINNFSFEDLSAEALQKFINEARLPFKLEQSEFKKYLTEIGILTYNKKSDNYIPSGFGILLFGLNPRNTFKQAALKCTAKIDGYELKPQSFEQPLVLIPSLVEDWLKTALGQRKDTTSFRIKNVPNFPLEALREAVINALVHRDYSIEGAKNSIEITNDAIIIKSPGAPLAAITLGQLNAFKAPSISRNPMITFIFNKMGYVEESGLGMATLRTLNEKFGLPLPEYTYEEPFLVLTFARDIEAVSRVSNIKALSQLTISQLNGYEWIKYMGEVSTREYSNNFNIGYKTAQRHLARMKELNLITDNGQDSNSPNYKYSVILDDLNP